MKTYFLQNIKLYFKGLFWILLSPFWFFSSPFKRRRFLDYLRIAWNNIPVISLEQLIPANTKDSLIVQVKAIVPREHNCTIFELFVLAIASKIVGATKVYEIGTYDGRSTMTLATNLSEKGIVYTLNLPENFIEENPEQMSNSDVQLSKKVKSGYRFLDQPEVGKIEQWFGDSMVFSAHTKAPFDVIFIDGGHTFEVVKHDSAEALKMINKQNGIILWHDSTCYGVGDYLPELRKQGVLVYRIYGTDMAIARFLDGKNVAFGRDM